MVSLKRGVGQPWKLEKEESQSQVLAATTQTVSREEGVGQIILITWWCLCLPVEEMAAVGLSPVVIKDLITYYRTHWCDHVTRVQWDQHDQKNPLSSPYIPGSPNFCIKPLYSHCTCQILTQISDTMCLHFSSFFKKIICNKFIFITFALFRNTKQKLLPVNPEGKENRKSIGCYANVYLSKGNPFFFIAL